MSEERQTLDDAIREMQPHPDSAAAETKRAQERDPEAVLEQAEGVVAEEPESVEETLDAEMEAEEAEEASGELDDEHPGDDTDEETAPENDVFKLTLATPEGENVEVELEGLDDDARAAVELLRERATVAEEMAQSYQQVRVQAEQNERDKLELQAIEDELRADPVGYVEERIAPEIRRDLVLQMLHDDDILSAVEDKLEEWLNDSSRREVDAAQRKVQRMELKQKAAAQRAAAQRNHEQAVAIYTTIESMIDPSWDRETQKLWVSDAINDVSAYVSRSKIDTLDPAQIPVVLKARMKQYGAKAPDTTKRPRVSKDEQAGDADAKLAEAKQTAKRIQTSVKRRRQAAGTPAGVSATPGSVKLKPGANLDDALAELKKRTRR